MARDSRLRFKSSTLPNWSCCRQGTETRSRSCRAWCGERCHVAAWRACRALTAELVESRRRAYPSNLRRQPSNCVHEGVKGRGAAHIGRPIQRRWRGLLQSAMPVDVLTLIRGTVAPATEKRARATPPPAGVGIAAVIDDGVRRIARPPWRRVSRERLNESSGPCVAQREGAGRSRPAASRTIQSAGNPSRHWGWRRASRSQMHEQCAKQYRIIATETARCEQAGTSSAVRRDLRRRTDRRSGAG